MTAYLNLEVIRQTSSKNPTMYFTLGLINVEATCQLPSYKCCRPLVHGVKQQGLVN